MKKIDKEKRLLNLESSLFGVVIFDYSPKCNILKANKEFYSIIGFTPEEFKRDYSNCITNLMTEQDIRYFYEKIRMQLEKSTDIDFEIPLNKKDGKRYLYIAGKVSKHFLGKKRLCCIVADITASKMANRQLLQINMDFDHFISNLPGGAYRFSDLDNREFNFVSKGMYELLCYDKSSFKEITGNRYENIIHPDDREKILKFTDKQIKEVGIYDVEYKIISLNNNVKWVADRGQVVLDSNGDMSVCGIITDITEAKMQKTELELSRKRYRIISESLEDVLFDYNIKEDKIIFSSRFLERFSTFDEEKDCREFINTSPLVFEEHRNRLQKLFEEAKKGEEKSCAEVLLYDGREGYKWYNIHLAVMFDELKNPIGAVGRLNCIHEQKKEVEKLLHKATIDSLTGLLNKSAVKSKIEAKLSEAVKTKEKCALIIIDIDNFKAINDNQGHLFGDNVLSEFSSVLSNEFKDNSIIGRVGGDEFIVLLFGYKTIAALKKYALKMCEIISNTDVARERDYSVSGSAGIALYPSHGEIYEELFKNADIALYSAKSKGKNRYEIYNGGVKSPMGTVVVALNDQYRRLCEDNGINSNVEASIITYMYENVNQSGKISEVVQNILSRLGNHYQYERLFVLGASPKINNGLELLYEWSENDCTPLSQKYGIVKFTSLEKYKKGFDSHGVLISCGFENVPVFKGFKTYVLKGEDKKVFHFAIFLNNRFAGSIVAVGYRSEQELSLDEFDAFTSLGRVFGSYVFILNQNNVLLDKNKYYDSLISKQGIFCYSIDILNFQITELDVKTKKLFPKASIGKKCFECFFGGNSICRNCPVLTIKDKPFVTEEIYNDTLSSWFCVTASKTDNNNVISIYSSNITNIIEKIKTKDVLTGLYSFPAFVQKAEKILAAYPDKNFAVLYMDIDKFKYINEAFGSETGDKVLISIANTLSSLHYYNEIICRSTADKFILLLRYTDKEAFVKRLGFIEQKMTELQHNNFKNIKITVIMGVYISVNDDRNINLMTDKANVARKIIKGSHKNNFFIYDSELHNKVTKEKSIENRMQYALDNDEFKIYFQPKKNLLDENIYGAEALVRWHLTDGSIFYPDEFISVFEKNGFIIEMDFYIFEKVFKIQKSWIDMGYSSIVISVNVSRMHMLNKDFVEKIKGLVEKYKVPPRLIELELTETIFIDYGEYMIDIINRLKAIGFSISIDDFGSGYSSLNLLKDLPVDVIKLDKSFFPNDTIGEKDKIVVSNIVRLAKELHIEVIAEGIESREQVNFLKEIYCNMAQGYFYSKPVTAEEFGNMIMSGKK